MADSLSALRLKLAQLSIAAQPEPKPLQFTGVTPPESMMEAGRQGLGRIVDPSGLPVKKPSAMEALRERLSPTLTPQEQAILPPEQVESPRLLQASAPPLREQAQARMKEQDDKAWARTHGFPDVFDERVWEKEQTRQYQNVQKDFVGPPGPPEPLIVEKDPVTDARIKGFLKFVEDQHAMHIPTNALGLLRQVGAGAAQGFGELAATISSAAQMGFRMDELQEAAMMAPAEGASVIAEGLRSRSALSWGGGVGKLVGEAGEVVGRVALDLPLMTAYGKFGLAAYMGFTGLAHGGPQGLVSGVLQGLLLHQALGGLGQFQSRAMRLGSQAALGYGVAAMEGADTKEKITSALTFGMLGVLGEKGKKNIDGATFLKLFPAVKNRLENRDAMRILKALAPDADLAVIKAAGGPKVVLERLVALAKEADAKMLIEPISSPAFLEPPLTGRQRIPEYDRFTRAEQRRRQKLEEGPEVKEFMAEQALLERAGLPELPADLRMANRLLPELPRRVDVNIDPRAEAERLQRDITPAGTGKEATGLSAIEQKMGEVMRSRPAPKPVKINTRQGEFELTPVDSILRNGETIGDVPKGQGEAIIKELAKEFPKDSFVINPMESVSSAPNTPAEILAKVKERVENTNKRRDSFFAKADQKVNSKSELFGEGGEAAHEAAVAAALKLEAAQKAKAGEAAPVAEPAPAPVAPKRKRQSKAEKDAALTKRMAEEEVAFHRAMGSEPVAQAAPGDAVQPGMPFVNKATGKQEGVVVDTADRSLITVETPQGGRFQQGKGTLRVENGKVFGAAAPEILDMGRAVDSLMTNLLDKFYPIHQMVKSLASVGIRPDVMADPSIGVKLLGGVGGMAEAKVFFKRFRKTPDGKVEWTGESLKDIIEPVKDVLGEFNDYLTYNSALEVNKNSKGKIETGIDLKRAKQFVDQNRARFEVHQKKFTEFFHSLLDEMVDSGLLAKDVAAKWKKDRPGYAPLRRDLDQIADAVDRGNAGVFSVRESLDKVGSPIKRMRGSELPVLPPTESAVLMTYAITSAVERNIVARNIIALRDLSPEFARVIAPTKPTVHKVRDLATGKDDFVIAERQAPDVVAVSIDGHRTYWKVPREIADSMKLIHESGLSGWVKFFSLPARTLRAGATTAPEFALRNPIRDWQTAFVNSKTGFNPLTDFTKGLFQMLAKPEEYWRWKASGGEWSTLASLDRAFGKEAVAKMRELKHPASKFVKTPLGYLEAMSMAGEKPTRLGIFSRSRKKGLSDLEAAVESREASTDFHVRGAKTKSLSALYTFLNARAQTTYKLARTARERPLQFMLRGFASAAIPAIALYAINRDDPDYWKRSDFERSMFWFLPIEVKGRQVKLPKGELGILFGTTIERVLQYLDSKAEYKPKVNDLIAGIMQASSPIGNLGEVAPTAARPIVEWMLNESLYFGTPIVSKSREGLARYRQYGPYTSETMKALGQSLMRVGLKEGASPAKLENTLRGYTGGVGRHALRVTDMIADKVGLVDRGPRPADPTNIPGVGGFLSGRAEGFESDPARRFYEIEGNLARYKATIKDQLTSGNVEEVQAWIKRHPTEMELFNLGLAPAFTKARDKLSELRKAQNMIVENKDLTGQEKAAALRIVDKQVSSLVDPLWKIVNMIESKKLTTTPR